jgi:hypothetical protein
VAPTAELLDVAMAYAIAGALRNASYHASLRHFFCFVVPISIIYLRMRTDGRGRSLGGTSPAPPGSVPVRPSVHMRK